MMVMEASLGSTRFVAMPDIPLRAGPPPEDNGGEEEEASAWCGGKPCVLALVAVAARAWSFGVVFGGEEAGVRVGVLVLVQGFRRWALRLELGRGGMASRTNFVRMLRVRPCRRSAMRRLRWTSSTTFVRRADTVASRREMEVETSFSLAPKAKVCVWGNVRMFSCGSRAFVLRVYWIEFELRKGVL